MTHDSFPEQRPAGERNGVRLATVHSVEMDARRCVWRWDGQRWIPTPLRSGARSWRPLTCAQGILLSQAGLLALVGMLALVGAVVAGFVGSGVSVAVGVAGGGIAVALLGLCLAWSGLHIDRVVLRRFAVVAQILLLPVGCALAASGVIATNNAGSPATPGTDGPIADGMYGYMTLAGLLLAAAPVSIPLIVLVGRAVTRPPGGHV